jgi:hypothetical protein
MFTERKQTFSFNLAFTFRLEVSAVSEEIGDIMDLVVNTSYMLSITIFFLNYGPIRETKLHEARCKAHSSK